MSVKSYSGWRSGAYPGGSLTHGYAPGGPAGTAAAAVYAPSMGGGAAVYPPVGYGGEGSYHHHQHQHHHPTGATTTTTTVLPDSSGKENLETDNSMIEGKESSKESLTSSDKLSKSLSLSLIKQR